MDRRPAPGLLIASTMLASWLITTLSYDWPVFREVSGLMMVTMFIVLTMWARVK